MDLRSLNPKVFQMWELQRSGGTDYFQPSTQEDITEIERLVETRIPDDYREFLLQYSTVVGSINVGAYFFPCRFKKKSVIMGEFLAGALGKADDQRHQGLLQSPSGFRRRQAACISRTASAHARQQRHFAD
ncbi:SMI1/KNR4 family protein [Aquamicrobium sp. LC103]|uniref:SMI1/KNR4 family protein n=1 Tax=Aquamicrobium sp. LC103 TaxID=1120658 RepID=UPI00109C5DF3|nr:SMI1/KNR4 family protein [Aquamicrobium sp. LC103]TKT80355.1 SMI1/KNR4 family protein [Aquamicrobium sp. LC103]